MGTSPGPRPGGLNDFSGGVRGRGGGGQGMGREFENFYRMHPWPQPDLAAPQTNAGTLPAPFGAQQTQHPAQVAVVQDKSDISSSENE